jgi:hypothetical protein
MPEDSRKDQWLAVFLQGVSIKVEIGFRDGKPFV